MTAFFDTSVVIALVNPAERNHSWSLAELTSRQKEGAAIISDVVYAEVAAGLPSQADLDAIIARFGFQRAERDDRALFNAGQRYKQYRKTKGSELKSNVLADFFIGAAAQALDVPIVTANPKDFRNFFSGLVIVHPSGQEVVP